MNVAEVQKELRKMPELKGFEWSEIESGETVYAKLNIENESFKKHGDEYLLGGFYGLFIAHMYKGQKGRGFFYITLSRPCKLRTFRKHKFEDIEYNKLFASGKTVKEVIRSFKEYFEKGYTIGDDNWR